MSASVVSGSSTLSSSSASLMMRMNPLSGQKAKKEIEKRRFDVKTYTTPIIFAGDEASRKAFYQAYHKKYNNSKKTSIYRLQVLRKHPKTVGNFYHELVEHSGRVTPEEFWQRYDYRCCDVGRVMGELQAAKEAGKRRKSQQQRLKKSKKQVKEYKEASEKTASMSWMSIKSSATASLKKSKKKKSQVPVGIEMAGTVDTADEEYPHDEKVDHVQEFKRSIGGDAGMIDVATATETSKTVQEDKSLGGIVGLASIFRNTKAVPASQASDEKKGETTASAKDISPPVKLVGMWLLFALLASVSLDPQRWMSQQFGNKFCAPIRPGSTVDTTRGGAETYVAPWWAPAVMKDSLFAHICAVDAQGNARQRTQLVSEVWPNRLLNRNEQHLSVKAIALDGNGGSGNVLAKIPRVSSFQVDATGSKVLVDHLSVSKEYDAPWALP